MSKHQQNEAKASLLQEVAVHLWKDIKNVRTGPTFFILLSLVLCFTCLTAYSISLDYHRELNTNYGLLSSEEIKELQSSSIFDFWSGPVAFLWPLIFTIMGTLLISQENEDGLITYILSQNARAIAVYFSKFLTLTILVGLTYAAYSAIFYVLFLAVGGDSLNVLSFLLSSALPMVGVLLTGMIGLLVASVVRKRNTSLVITLAYALLAYSLSSFAFSDGTSNVDPSSQGSIEFGIFNKILYLTNPMVVKEGMLNVLDLHNIDGVFIQNYYQVYDTTTIVIYAAVLFFSLIIINVRALERKRPLMEKTREKNNN